MALNSTTYPNTSRVISGSAVLFQNDLILLCNTSTAPVSMTLLEIPSGYWQTTWKLYVLDNSNNAGTNNITINAPSGYTINNASSLVINTNGGGVTITIASNTAFFGQVSPLPSGGGGTITAITGTLPISVTSGSTPDVSIPAADTTTDGYITATDWTRFDDKTKIYLGAALKVSKANELTFNTGYFDVTNPFTYTGRINMLDSGWVDLEGFAWMDATLRPKCRRLGSAIYFKGNAVVPMRDPSNTANLYQPYDATTFYYEKVFETSERN